MKILFNLENLSVSQVSARPQQMKNSQAKYLISWFICFRRPHIQRELDWESYRNPKWLNFPFGITKATWNQFRCFWGGKGLEMGGDREGKGEGGGGSECDGIFQMENFYREILAIIFARSNFGSERTTFQNLIPFLFSYFLLGLPFQTESYRSRFYYFPSTFSRVRWFERIPRKIGKLLRHR